MKAIRSKETIKQEMINMKCRLQPGSRGWVTELVLSIEEIYLVYLFVPYYYLSYLYIGERIPLAQNQPR